VSGTRQRVGAATPFFGIKGELLVLFEDFGADAVDFGGESAAPAYDGAFSLVLARSSDFGRTFTEASTIDDAVKPLGRFNPYTPIYPSVAVAPQGKAPRGDAIYVAWGDATSGDWNVFVRRSGDDGATWGDRVQVGADRVAGTNQYLPAVSVAIDGRVDVAFLDRSEGGPDKVLTGAVLASSFDAGATWNSVTVSDKLFDSRVGTPTVNPAMAETGSRLGLISEQTRVVMAWTDARNGTDATARQDVYLAPVTVTPAAKS
jgi:hypothetical protein